MFASLPPGAVRVLGAPFGLDLGAIGKGSSLLALVRHAVGASDFAVRGAHILDPLTGAPRPLRRPTPTAAPRAYGAIPVSQPTPP